MKAVGIIAEYNPFHYGHQYLIREAMRITGADACIVVMSGDYVQRGEPALTDKYRRTAMALAGGADVVLELPVSYATGTAERFALGGVYALHSLGVVTDLVYGCETPESPLWEPLTSLLCRPTEEYRALLDRQLADGLTYAAARAAACEHLLPGAGELLSSPNNILAMEYRKAISSIPGCTITAHPVQRIGKGYHDTTLEDCTFASATAIRKLLSEQDPADEQLRQMVPDTTANLLNYEIEADDLSPQLRYALLNADPGQLADLQDMNPDLARRLLHIFHEHPEYTFTQLAEHLKTRNITRTRANRALLHAVLSLHGRGDRPSALRLLGFRRDTGILRPLMDRAEIPVVTKMADAPEEVFTDDIRTSMLYHQLVFGKTGAILPDEYRRGPVIYPDRLGF